MKKIICLALLGLGIYACAQFMGGPGACHISVYNETGAEVALQAGSKKMTLGPGERAELHKVELTPGAALIASSGGAVIEENRLDPGLSGKQLIYNVKGKGRLVAVDYTGCYQMDDTAVRGDAADTAPPFKIVAELQGQSLFTLPLCNLVQYTDAFPKAVIGTLPVIRIESVPENLGSKTLEEYLLNHLQHDLKMRAHIYK